MSYRKPPSGALARELTRLIHESGRPQRKIAELAGLDVGHLNRLRTGRKTTASRTSLLRVARALGAVAQPEIANLLLSASGLSSLSAGEEAWLGVRPLIAVVGVGGAGGRVVSRLMQNPSPETKFVAVDTDAKALSECDADVRVILGEGSLAYTGAGGDAALARRAAESHRNQLKELLNGIGMVVIVSSLGGGTGTGAMPVIAELANEAGCLAVAVVTTPFSFEGPGRRQQAEDGISLLRQKTDALTVIHNDRLYAMSSHKTKIAELLSMRDDLLSEAIRGLCELVTLPGDINLDLADVRLMMSQAGMAVITVGKASGDNREVEAARAAISSPLLASGVQGARSVLFNLASTTSVGLRELQMAAEAITEVVDPDGQIIFGASVDPRLGDEARITLVATGLADQLAAEFAGGRVPQAEELVDSSSEGQPSVPTLSAKQRVSAKAGSRDSRYERRHVQPNGSTLKILQIAPVWETVPPPAYGGTEAVVSVLTEELVRRGHDVTLCASGDSRTRAELLSVLPHGLRTARDLQDPWPYAWLHSTLALKEADEFDIIHNHAGEPAMALAHLVPDVPMLSTMHRLITPDTKFIWDRYPGYYNTISMSQRRKMPPLAGGHFVGVVYNAIDVPSFPYDERKEDYLLFLSRISVDKMPHLAVEVARRTGRRLIIAGKVDRVDEHYFNSELAPLIDGKQVQFMGEVDARLKRELFAKAYCLVLPLSWEEPFGLVMIEAMACGTPVVSFARGSAPEVVVDGETGYIVRDVDEMVDAVGRVDRISPRRCRQYVEDNFDAPLMVSRYLQAYQRIIARAREYPELLRAAVDTA